MIPQLPLLLLIAFTYYLQFTYTHIYMVGTLHSLFQSSEHLHEINNICFIDEELRSMGYLLKTTWLEFEARFV